MIARMARKVIHTFFAKEFLPSGTRSPGVVKKVIAFSLIFIIKPYLFLLIIKDILINRKDNFLMGLKNEEISLRYKRALIT